MKVSIDKLKALSPGGMAAFGDAVAMTISMVTDFPAEYPPADIDLSTVTPFRVDQDETLRVTETRPKCQSNFAADSQPSVAEAAVYARSSRQHAKYLFAVAVTEAAIYARSSSVARNPVGGNRPADRWPHCPW